MSSIDVRKLFERETMAGVISRIATTTGKTSHMTDNITPEFHQNDNTDAKIIMLSLLCIVVLVITTIVVTLLKCRTFCAIFKREAPKSKPSHELYIPDHQINFTIPTAPQMPHEMPRGNMMRASFPSTTNGGKRKRNSLIRPPLAIIGRSKSDKTEASIKRHEFAMARSKSEPHLLNLTSQSPITSTIGTIDPKLYSLTKEEDDLQEFRPSKYGLGKLSFSLMYQQNADVLTVHLIQAAQLPILNKQQKNGADTCVKVLLLPDEENKRRPSISRIFKRSLNPRFNQTFVFRLPDFAIAQSFLRCIVFQYDRFSHPHVVGRADYDFGTHDFDALGADHTIWRDLVEHPWEDELPPVDTNRGEVLISLNYLPNAQRLNVVVLKARHLRTSIADSATIVPYNGADSEAVDQPGPSTMSNEAALGIYVKVSTVKGGKQIKTKQTNVVRKDLNPVFNQSFAMELKTDDLDISCIVFAVCLRVNHLKFHRILGRCVVGGDIICSGKASAHWKEMLESPRKSAAQWHTLK